MYLLNKFSGFYTIYVYIIIHIPRHIKNTIITQADFEMYDVLCIN